MRLADEIASAAGGPGDQITFGAIGAFAKLLAEAQCFELSADVVAACREVPRSKPSSLLSALPYVRVPYERVWLEWQPLGEEDEEDDDQARPLPKRIGCLIESAPSLDYGMMRWAWMHGDSVPAEGRLVVSLWMGVFNWRVDGDLQKEMYWTADMIDKIPPAKAAAIERYFGAPLDPEGLRQLAKQQVPTADQAGEHMRSGSTYWARLANDREEMTAAAELGRHFSFMLNIHYMDFAIAARRIASEAFQQQLRNTAEDVKGEHLFATAFLMLLNARHGLASNREDLARLNRKRTGSGKRALREFVITRLDLSRGVASRAAARGLSREAARRHLVRGHFKVRRSGIYWWSPFVRGRSGEVPLKRESYAAQA